MRTLQVRTYGPRPLNLQGDRLGELLLAVYVSLLPWEITRLFIPLFRSHYLGGTYLSAFDGSRLWIVVPLCLVLPVVANRLSRESKIPATGVLGYGILVMGIGLALSPERSTAAMEVVRLLFNFVAMVMLATHLRRAEAVRRVIRWFCVSVDLAAVIVIAEFLTGRYLFVGELAPSGRFNGPFVDPNTSARYFLVAAILSVFCSWRPGRFSRTLSVLEPLLLLAAMFLTGSRSSLLVAAIVILFMIPLADGARRLVPMVAMPTLVVLSAAMVAVTPSFATRLSSFTSPAALLGARSALVNAGFHMFLDHPVAGVGLSGFATSLLGPYASYQSYYGADLTLSHTSIVTTAAELGAIGLIWFVVFWHRVVVAAKQARRSARTRTLATGVLLGITAIFLQSQSEGRFWEEPLLWASLGLLIALSRASRPSEHSLDRRC